MKIHSAQIGFLTLSFSSGCVSRQASADFVGEWSVTEIRVDGESIPFPAMVVDDDCTNGYQIWAESNGTSGEVRYDYSYDCGDDLGYYSLLLPVVVRRKGELVEVEGVDLSWSCSSLDSESWACSRSDGAVLVLEPV